MWCEFERCFDDLEGSVTEANILQHAVGLARRDERGSHELQVLQWVIEGHGAERLSLSADQSSALAARVISRVVAALEDRNGRHLARGHRLRRQFRSAVTPVSRDVRRIVA